MDEGEARGSRLEIDPVSFHDAGFAEARMWAHSSLDGLSLRWLAFGMPRLNRRLGDIAFFLYGRNPKSPDEIVGPVGSGVFVAVPVKGAWGLGHTYAVTCHHCLLEGATIIRVNTSDGSSRLVETEPHEWHFDPRGSDIAVLDATELISPRRGDQISVVPTTQFATKEFMRRTDFGIGEDGFMLGLFSEHAGKNRNLVAARFGNVSLLADDAEPLDQPNRSHRRPSHLFDMHSRPGSSGSPVMVYRTPAGDLRTAQLRGSDKPSVEKIIARAAQRRASAVAAAQADYRIQDAENYVAYRENISTDRRITFETENNTFLVLLGIHVGQYHDAVTAKKAVAIRPEFGEPIKEGDLLDVPNSMALVAPAWDIVELLMIDKLVLRRGEREALDAAKRGNVAKPEAT